MSIIASTLILNADENIGNFLVAFHICRFSGLFVCIVNIFGDNFGF